MINALLTLLTLTAGPKVSTPLMASPCIVADSTVPSTQRWELGDLSGWMDASQNMNGQVNYTLSHDTLRIFTRSNTWDRPKIKTTNAGYTTGTYTWRIYTPLPGAGDMSSIGAFLYQDDTHELDFETGYGSSAVRKTLGAQNGDMIVYMTSQAFPFQSIPKKIKAAQWHTFSIRLDNHDGKYLASWYVDGEQAVSLPLGFGPEARFAIYCSMENIKFIGDHIAGQDNYALFDYVEYKTERR